MRFYALSMKNVNSSSFCFVNFIRILRTSIVDRFKTIAKSSDAIDWLVVFLRDVGAAIISGLVLGLVLGQLEWKYLVLPIISSLLLCYISFVLTIKEEQC